MNRLRLRLANNVFLLVGLFIFTYSNQAIIYCQQLLTVDLISLVLHVWAMVKPDERNTYFAFSSIAVYGTLRVCGYLFSDSFTPISWSNLSATLGIAVIWLYIVFTNIFNIYSMREHRKGG